MKVGESLYFALHDSFRDTGPLLTGLPEIQRRSNSPSRSTRLAKLLRCMRLKPAMAFRSRWIILC